VFLVKHREAVLIGVDIGTSSVKVVAFDETANRLWSTHKPLTVVSPAEGWFEQDVKEVYVKVKDALREVFENIAGNLFLIGFSSTSPGLVALDASGEPLSRAILWMDRRAVTEADEVVEKLGLELVYRRTGLRVDSIFTALKIMWLKRNNPQVFSKARYFVQVKDYILYKLTNETLTDFSHISETLLYTLEGRWFSEILELIGIDESLFFEPNPSTTLLPISREASEELGITGKEVYVALGGVDSVCAALGAGGVTSNILIDTTGTSTCLDISVEKPIVDREMRFEAYYHVIPGYYVVEACTSTSGEALKKILELLGDPSGDPDKYIDSYEPSGIIFFPFLAGSRSPDWNPSLRGLIYGLSLRTRREDLVKGVLEGVAFWERNIVEALNNMGLSIDEIRTVGGGATRNWARVKANITGKRIVIPAEREASALGAAFLAGLGYGIYKSARDILNIIRVDYVAEPERELGSIYDRLYAVYVALWNSVKSISRMLT